jgi:hypothetical protein
MSCTRRPMVFLLLPSVAFAAQWTPVSAGLTGSIPAVSALVIDRSIGSTLYAVTSLAPLRLSAEASSIFNVFKSTDGGTSWKALADIAGVNVLAIDPVSASIIYAGTAGGVFKSTNGGDSWETSLSGTSISVFAIDPITPSNLYAAGDKFYKSTDAGASWTALSFGAVGSLTIDSLRSTLYAVANGSPDSNVLYKSTDAGQSWSVVTSGLGSLLAITPTTPPTTPATLYAILDANTGSPGFSKSTDGGATWTPIGGVQGVCRSFGFGDRSNESQHDVHSGRKELLRRNASCDFQKHGRRAKLECRRHDHPGCRLPCLQPWLECHLCGYRERCLQEYRRRIELGVIQHRSACLRHRSAGRRSDSTLDGLCRRERGPVQKRRWWSKLDPPGHALGG